MKNLNINTLDFFKLNSKYLIEAAMCMTLKEFNVYLNAVNDKCLKCNLNQVTIEWSGDMVSKAFIWEKAPYINWYQLYGKLWETTYGIK